MQEDTMEESVVFRAQFMVAWPIWAGGYPTQQQALRVFEEHRETLVGALHERLHSLLGTGFSLGDLHCQIGTHSPIRGLWPQGYVPNSINIVVVVSAPDSRLQQLSNLTSRVEDAVEGLADMLSTFSLTHMPGAQQGANIYDVASRWEPGPLNELVFDPNTGQLVVLNELVFDPNTGQLVVRMKGDSAPSDEIPVNAIKGFDHRVGRFGPLKIMSESLKAPVLRCVGAFAAYLGNWGGRRHDQGPIML
jgi:hypothetical protein